MTATSAREVLRRPMGRWRLEWLRLTRSARGVSLLGTFLVLGLVGPVLARYLPSIVGHAQEGVTIIVPPPTPADGLANYLDQANQIGLVVAVVVAAGALAFDSRPGLSTFLRTRVDRMWDLLAPRFTVTAVAVVLAYLVGALAAWYGTVLLLGHLPPGAVLAGLLCEAAYLVLVVAVVAAAASFVRGTIGTVGLSLGVLLLLPLLGLVHAVHDWLPSSLTSAPVELVGTATLSTYVPALVVSVVATVLLLVLAVARLGRREV